MTPTNHSLLNASTSTCCDIVPGAVSSNFTEIDARCLLDGGDQSASVTGEYLNSIFQSAFSTFALSQQSTSVRTHDTDIPAAETNAELQEVFTTNDVGSSLIDMRLQPDGGDQLVSVTGEYSSNIFRSPPLILTPPQQNGSHREHEVTTEQRLAIYYQKVRGLKTKIDEDRRVLHSLL